MPCTEEECREFFASYDHVFAPDEVRNRQTDEMEEAPGHPPDLYANEVEILVPFLIERAQARANGNAIPDENAAQRAAKNILERAQLQLFQSHDEFTTEDGLDYECIQECFEEFANGELRQPDPDVAGREREPDGSFFFLFAEFALLAIENGLHTDIWTNLLQTFTKCEEIFRRAYPPQDNQGQLFGRDRTFDPDEQLNEGDKQDLRDEYDDLDRDELERKHEENIDDATTQSNVSMRTPEDRFGASNYANLREQLAEMDRLVDDLVGSPDLSRETAATLESLASVVASQWQTATFVFGPAIRQVGFAGSSADLTAGGREAEPVTVIEGIGDERGERLTAELGVRTVGDLAQVDPETELPGITTERLAEFEAMAELLVDVPGLTPEDAQVLVAGLGVSGSVDLRERAPAIGEAALAGAVDEVEVPASYSMERLLSTLREL